MEDRVGDALELLINDVEKRAIPNPTDNDLQRLARILQGFFIPTIQRDKKESG